jgi:hypothetical protein
VVNSNRRVRSRLVQRFIAHPPDIVRAVARKAIPTRERRRSLRMRLLAWNAPVEPRQPIDPALRLQLQRELEPEVAALEELLGRELTAWRSVQVVGL